MKNTIRKAAALILSGIMALSLTACKEEKKKEEELLDADNPVTITVWNYYGGYQLSAFEEMVSDFNATVGEKEGIIVESVAQGSIDGLISQLNDAVDGKAGAQDVPNVVCVYPDTARTLEDKDLLVSLDSYYTDKELDVFVEDFLEEGRLEKGGELKIIPVSKSTELLMYNKTDFDKFAAETNVRTEDMKTIEGIVKISEEYYKWTDAQTPDVAEDGKAFFGWDSLANYVVNGSAQLGNPVLYTDDNNKGQCNLDKETMRKLWDNYYVPYINGYFGSYGRFRSDDAKVGKIVASVGSSSGIDYFPTTVTLENDVSYEIEVGISEAPNFEGGKDIELQQGAGFSVLRSTEQEQYASVRFLKYITQKEQNMQFSIGANYMPVLKEALEEDELQDYFEDKDMSEALKESLQLCASMVKEEKLWVVKPFAHYSDLRTYLADELQSVAEADRAAVVEKINGGASREEAVGEFVSDEYFDGWYQKQAEKTAAIMAE